MILLTNFNKDYSNLQKYIFCKFKKLLYIFEDSK